MQKIKNIFLLLCFLFSITQFVSASYIEENLEQKELTNLKNINNRLYKIKISENLVLPLFKQIKLEDIGLVEGKEPEILQAIKSLKVNHLFLTKQNKTWKSAEILAQFSEDLNQIKKNYKIKVSLEIPEFVSLKTDYVLSENEIKNQILQNYLMQCNSCKFEITDLKIPQIPKYESYAEFENTIKEVEIRSLQNYFVISIKGKTQLVNQNFWISGAIKIHTLLLVAQNKINVNEKLNLINLKNAWVEIKNKYEDYISQASEIENFVAAQTIAAGQAISKKMLKKETIITKGQLLKTVSQLKDLELSFLTQAEESGGLGDVIKVKNIENNKVFYAKIVNAKLLELQ